MELNDYFKEIVNNVYMFKKEDLDKIKTSITGSEIDTLDELLETVTSKGLRSVMDKKLLAPSNDPHDYVSISIYHWPNPNTKDGLPYIERDGVDNPESFKGDKEALRELAYITYLAGVLYYITKSEKYLDIILRFNINWFINEKTKMNPHIKYGQYIPGVNEGEPGAIIDYAASYGYALNVLSILNKEKFLPNEFVLKMQEWHKDFYVWLNSFERCLIIRDRNNNQSALYNLLVLNIARFIGSDSKIINEMNERLVNKINIQINDEGLLPEELQRTKTKSYTTMGLKMLLESARFLMDYGFTYNAIGKLLKSYEYMKPRYINEFWDHEQITYFDPFRGYYILYLFSKVLNDNLKLELIKKENHFGYIFLRNLF